VAPNQQENTNVSMERGMRIKRIISVVKRVEFISDRIIYNAKRSLV
jgi:hypothetical protein